MYRFKYYYKNGKVLLSEKSYSDISEFDEEMQALTKNEHFQTTADQKKDFGNYLKLAIQEYDQNFSDLYRIDILDEETKEVLGYVDNSEALVDVKKGHLVYDANSGDVISATIDKDPDDGIYRFKYYYRDGTTDVSAIKTSKPEELYNDFDGLIEWEELYAFDGRKVTTKEVLETAVKAYKGFLPDFYRIEIINDKTGEVVDYIEMKAKN